MISLEPMAWASRTPDIPMTYSPSVNPTTVCLTTSALDLLNRVMSGVMTAPTMNPPATSVVPVARLMGSPGGGVDMRAPTSLLDSSAMIAQPTRTRNAGTVTYAVQAIDPNPKMQMAVTTSPKRIDHPQAGSPPRVLASPWAETADWMPNQPMRLMPMARPMSADPPRPNPSQRATIEVDMPSREPMMPTKIETTSRMTAPNVNAQNAVQKLIPNPSVAPRRNWLRAETWPKRWIATDHHV